MSLGEASGARVEPAETPTVGQLLNVVLAAVIVGALYLGREFLVPLTLAILLAFVLAPLVRLLRRWRIPHAAAVLVTVALSLGAVSGLGALIGSQVASLGQDLPKYQGAIENKLQVLGGLTTGKLAEMTGRFSLQATQAGHQAARAAGLAGPSSVPAAKPTLVEVYRPPATPMGVARQVIRPILTPLARLGLVFVLAVFILLQQADLRDRLIRLIGSGDLHRTTIAMNDAATRLSRYFLSQLTVNLGFGAAIGTGLAVIGVPHAALWGAVAALMRFIPYLGALISTSLAMGMAAAVDPGWAMVVWTAGLFLVVEAITGQFVEPLLYGHSTGLSPVSVVVAAVFWTWLWGPVGLILSTPLSLCLLVLGRHVPRLAFIDVLLGDRPPLTPVESFYQRVLAGDADEVLQQAEAALTNAGLTAYYDDVALKGLLLAASDAQRGILKRDRLVGFRAIVEGLIADLADAPVTADDIPGEWPAAADDQAGATVLCIGGPGLLDDLGASMLCQLLAKHGLVASSLSYRSIASDTVEAQEPSTADVLFVFHLAVGRHQSRLRRLLRRLETHAAGSQMFLVMVCADEVAGLDGDTSADLGVVADLRGAVATGLALTAPPAKPAARRRPKTRRAA